MNEYEQELLDSRNGIILAIAKALEHGVPLSRCLELLGVEGKPATLLRAFLGRYQEGELAGALRELVENPSNE